MAHLWFDDPDNQERRWSVLPLDAAAGFFEILPDGQVRPTADEGGGANSPSSCRLVHSRPLASDEEWVLMAREAHAVRVGGVPLLAGLRVLRDRDEIILEGGQRFFFSKECLARIESSPATGESLLCQRCRQPIAEGTDAVHCPQCGLWYHQSDTLPCWTYSPQCAVCGGATNLSTAQQFHWTPEGL